MLLWAVEENKVVPVIRKLGGDDGGTEVLNLVSHARHFVLKVNLG